MKRFPVTDYGTYDENAANHDDLINGALAAAIAHGSGEVYFPYLGPFKFYRHTGIGVQQNDIGLAGEYAGGDLFGRKPTNGKGCVLQYVGQPNGIGVYFSAPASANWPIRGCYARDLQIDGNNRAWSSFRIGAVQTSSFKRLHIQGGLGSQFETVAVPFTQYINQSGAYQNYAEQIFPAASGTSIGALFAGDWTQDNAGGRHTAFLQIVGIHVTHENGIAYHFNSCDDVVILGAAVSRIAGGTGAAIYFNGSSSGNRAAEGNFIFGINGQGMIRAVGGSRPSVANTVFCTSIDTQMAISKDADAKLYVFDSGGNGIAASFRHPQLIPA